MLYWYHVGVSDEWHRFFGGEVFPMGNWMPLRYRAAYYLGRRVAARNIRRGRM